MVKGWRSNRGYMFAMMLAMLALMAVMGVGLSRLLVTTKATTQMQRSQDNKQLMNSLVMTLSSKAADSDGDFVLEPPAYSTETITGFAAPTNGGFVGTDVVNVDAWGRRLGYCAYDYGSATATPPSGTGLIRGSTDSSPTDSWVAVVVISAGPDGVINSTCPAADTLASDVAATGDDMVAARSYGEMVSFGNAQIASTLSGLGTNNQNKLCRLNDSGKMVCDVVIDACTVYQASKWNATSSKFDCINFKPADCAGGRQHSENWSTSCPSGQTGTINYQCLNGVTSQTSAVCYNNCGGQTHGSTWSTSCPSGQTGDISYQCNNGNSVETGRSCTTPPPPPPPPPSCTMQWVNVMIGGGWCTRYQAPHPCAGGCGGEPWNPGCPSTWIKWGVAGDPVQCSRGTSDYVNDGTSYGCWELQQQCL